MKFVEFFPPENLVEGPKIMFELPFKIGGQPVQIAETVTTTWIIMIFFLVLFAVCIRKLEKYPSKLQTIFEMMYEFYDWLVDSVMGKNKRHFFVYIGTLITYIFAANITSFFPIPSFTILENGKIVVDYAFKSPTSDLNTTLGLACVTAILFTYYGIKANGILGHGKNFLEPTFIMLPLNLISEAAKPVSISMRLFGNMLAGGVILGIMYKFATKLPIVPMVIAPLHLYFDAFASLVQSFIFTMLTMIFITQAIGDKELE